MAPEQLKDWVIKILDDGKGSGITALDVRGVSTVTDFMVVASGHSQRQVKSLASQVAEKAKGRGIEPLGMEGHSVGEWVLVDLGDVVVHVMLPPIRDFYGLEKLWGT